VSGVNSGGGVVAAPRSWLCYFASFAMSQAAIPDPPTELQVKLREQRSHDLKAIRDAIVEDIENFDTYSKIADKEDEAVLKGKRSILTLFDVYVRWLESL
jgi:hypothetical protein